MDEESSFFSFYLNNGREAAKFFWLIISTITQTYGLLTLANDSTIYLSVSFK